QPDGGIKLDGQINPGAGTGNVPGQVLDDHVEEQGVVGLVGPDGKLLSQLQVGGTMEKAAMQVRMFENNLSQLTNASDLTKKGNLAVASIQLVGETQGRLQVAFTRPVGDFERLQVFSSGKGSGPNEFLKLPVYDTRGNLLRAAGGTPPPGLVVPKIQIE